MPHRSRTTSQQHIAEPAVRSKGELPWIDVIFRKYSSGLRLSQRAQAQSCVRPCYPRDQAEIDANVTPIDTSYEPGPFVDARRHGYSESATALQNAQFLDNAAEYTSGFRISDVGGSLGGQTKFVKNGGNNDDFSIDWRNTTDACELTSAIEWASAVVSYSGSVIIRKSHNVASVVRTSVGNLPRVR
jgi:hypothetical protein